MGVKETVLKEYFCDLCKKQVEKENQLTKINVPVRFTTEQNEGRACKPYIEQTNFELCEECLGETVKITGHGAQGYNEYNFI